MLSLVSLALFGTAHAQNCGVSLTQAGGMMLSNTPPSYACTDWIRVRFTYTGSIEVFGRNGCGVVLYNGKTQRTVWSNGGGQGRGQTEYYAYPGQRYRYYYLLCPGDGGVAHAMQSRPRGRRLEQDVPTLQRRLNNQNFWGEALVGGEYGEDDSSYDFEADALVGDYDFGSGLYLDDGEDMWADMGEDLWADMGEDLWADMGEDLFSDEDDDGEDMWDGQEDMWDGQEDMWDGQEDVWDGQEDLVSDDDDQLGTGLDAMNLNFGNGFQFGDDLSTLGDNPLGTGLGAMNTDFGEDLQ